jgi:hypothetical protein
MIIFVSSKQVKKNLRKWGIKDVSDDAVAVFNKSLYAFVKNEVAKWIKSNKVGKVSQNGGRVLMPQEYFGIPSNHYVESKMGTDFSATESLIRPSIDTHMAGGGDAKVKFDVSLKAIGNVCTDVCSSLQYNGVMPRDFHKALKTKVEDIFTQFVSSVKRVAKEEQVGKTHLNKVLSFKKYKVLT